MQERGERPCTAFGEVNPGGMEESTGSRMTSDNRARVHDDGAFALRERRAGSRVRGQPRVTRNGRIERLDHEHGSPTAATDQAEKALEHRQVVPQHVRVGIDRAA